MHINGISHIHGAQPLNQPHRVGGLQSAQRASGFSAVDQLDLSPAASYLSQAHDAPEIRADRVAAIRAQIADGMYETDDKLDLALERLLDEIG